MGHFLKGKKKLPKLLEILRDEKKDDSFWRKFRLLLFFLICSVPYEPTTFNLLCISKYYYFYVKTFSKVTHSDKSVEILSRKYFFQTNEKNWYFCGYFSLLNDCSLYFWRIKNVLHIITFETTIICWKILFLNQFDEKYFIKHYYETFLVCTHCELEKKCEIQWLETFLFKIFCEFPS